MLGPVHWASYPGEYLEMAMAVLVAQDHPETVRRTPASGDGGIDLMIPAGDGYEVRQVKSFTGRIGSGERRQIQESWQTLLADPRLSRRVTAYRLVVPVDPTPPEQAWFDDLTKDTPWPSTWLGEVHWHDLASRHPHVIDYVFGGGRDRVAKRATALQSAIHNPMNPISSQDVGVALGMMLEALNREDPHYRYEFHTSAMPPEPGDLRDGVFTHTAKLADGGYLTTVVIPKHRYSLHDSPIQGTFNITVEGANDVRRFREDLRSFEQFGRVLDIPEGSMSATIEAPSGLGGTYTNVRGTIGPTPLAATLPPARLVAVTLAGHQLVDLPVTVQTATAGLLGGVELFFADDPKLLTGSLQLDPPDSSGGRAGSLTISVGNIAGRPVLAVLPALKLLLAAQPPNILEVRPRYGAGMLASAALPPGSITMPEALVQYVEDLALAQSRAIKTITVPEEIEPRSAFELHHLGRMLRGETITGTWDEVTYTLKPGVPRHRFSLEFAQPKALLHRGDGFVTIEDERINLGHFIIVYREAVTAPDQPEDEGLVRFIPGSDPTYFEQAITNPHPSST